MNKRHGRPAFTLVELLVVMSLIAILATIAIAFLPNAASAQREARAATQLQGWLNIAKQRAMRDRAPRGLRLWVTTSNVAGVTLSNVVTDCQYIEQPDDFTGGLVRTLQPIGISPASPPIWSGPPGNVTVTITTISPHYLSVGESVLIGGNPIWSSNPYVVPPPPMSPPPPPPTGTPKEFRGSQVVASVPNPTTFTFNYTGPAPMPEALGLTPTPRYGSVSSGARFVFGNNQGLPAPSPDLMNGNYPLNPASPTLQEMRLWAVQPGDYIEFFGSGLVSQIIDIDYVPGQPMEIKVTPGQRNSIATATPNYRILRSPRVVGDEVLKLPDNTLIDLDTNATFNNPTPPLNPAMGTGYVDILFAPNGSVISRGVSTSNIHLWVRAPAQDNPADFFRGDPTIVSVFVQTGLVGAYSPDRATVGNPYTLVR